MSMESESDDRSDDEKIASIIVRDPRYRREAYRFVQDALEYTRQQLSRSGHVTGQELSLGVKNLAKERFGLMAKTVLFQWGIRATLDIGNIVFNMVEENLMIKQDEDFREDFENVFDFDEAFDADFTIELEGP